MPTPLQRQIERITGVSRTALDRTGRYAGRSVNIDKVQRGKRFGFGTTTQKRSDLVAAFGGD